MFIVKPDLPPITKEAFAAAALREPPARPTLPKTKAALNKLTPEARHDLDHARYNYIQRMRPFETTDVIDIRKRVTQRRSANAGHAGASTAVAVSGSPGIGKTQATLQVLYEAYRDATRPGRSWAEPGYEDIPIVYMCLTGATTPKQLKTTILNYMGRPVGQREREAQLDAAVAGLLNGCGTQVICFDEIHHLGARGNGRNVADAIKNLTEMARCTFMYVGVNLKRSEVLGEHIASALQIRTRTDLVEMSPFSIAATDDEIELESIIAAFEQHLPLVAHEPGSLADDHTRYLWERTQGRFRSLSELLRLGAIRAIENGDEKITCKLLDGIAIDMEAESRR